MRKKTLFWILALLFITPFCFAADPDFYFKSGEDVVLTYPCIIDNDWCGDTSVCSLTVIGPLGNELADRQMMDRNGVYFNYTLYSDSLTNLGVYKGSVVCNQSVPTGSESLSDNFNFLITDENILYENSLMIILGMGMVILILLIIGYSVDKEHYLLKLLFYMFAVGLIPLIPKLMIWGDHSLSIFYISTVWIVRIFYVYVFLYFIYTVLIVKILKKWNIVPKESRK